MATVADVLSLARTLSGKDSNSLTDTIGLALANNSLMALRLILAERREDLFTKETAIDILATNIIGGATPGIFNFPTDILTLKALFINYIDPTNQNVFKPMTIMDPSNLPMGQSLDWIRLNASQDKPQYDYQGATFEVFPTPKDILTGAIKCLYFMKPTEYTATSSNIIYPESVDWRALAYMIGSDYLFSIAEDNATMNLAKLLMDKTNIRVESFINAISEGAQNQANTKNVPLSGYEF
jgi:hypothetical protein